MSLESKIRELLAQTGSGQIRWQETYERGALLTALPGGLLFKLGERSGKVYLQTRDLRGAPVPDLSVSPIVGRLDLQKFDPLLNELYDLALRSRVRLDLGVEVEGPH